VLKRDKVDYSSAAVEGVVAPIAETIRQQDNLMANYLVKYFNGLAAQIIAMDSLMTEKARAAYVVGCSWLKGQFVETDVMVGRLMEALGLGWQVVRIDRLRRRHSGKDLHESIVYAAKPAGSRLLTHGEKLEQQRLIS
jgi:hypothetical protein